MSFRLSSQRCEQIKEIVVEAFEYLDIKSVPISGFEIATKLGAEIVPYSTLSDEVREVALITSEDGFVARANGKWTIYYNETKGFGRINYTLIHESGHIVLDHSEASELAEAEANFFAKYAIAPPPLIHKFKLKTPQEIHNIFDISLEAAEYAYNYYRKWLTYGNKDYTDYEIRLLQLFKEAL